VLRLLCFVYGFPSRFLFSGGAFFLRLPIFLFPRCFVDGLAYHSFQGGGSAIFPSPALSIKAGRELPLSNPPWLRESRRHAMSSRHSSPFSKLSLDVFSPCTVSRLCARIQSTFEPPFILFSPAANLRSFPMLFFLDQGLIVRSSLPYFAAFLFFAFDGLNWFCLK